jgi:hypothetical protein
MAVGFRRHFPGKFCGFQARTPPDLFAQIRQTCCRRGAGPTANALHYFPAFTLSAGTSGTLDPKRGPKVDQGQNHGCSLAQRCDPLVYLLPTGEVNAAFYLPKEERLQSVRDFLVLPRAAIGKFGAAHDRCRHEYCCQRILWLSVRRHFARNRQMARTLWSAERCCRCFV